MKAIPNERAAIRAAHPMQTGRHDLYNEAMRLVGERHAKGDLVDLVVWLLLRVDVAETECARLALAQRPTSATPDPVKP